MLPDRSHCTVTVYVEMVANVASLIKANTFAESRMWYARTQCYGGDRQPELHEINLWQCRERL